MDRGRYSKLLYGKFYINPVCGRVRADLLLFIFDGGLFWLFRERLGFFRTPSFVGVYWCKGTNEFAPIKKSNQSMTQINSNRWAIHSNWKIAGIPLIAMDSVFFCLEDESKKGWNTIKIQYLLHFYTINICSIISLIYILIINNRGCISRIT